MSEAFPVTRSVLSATALSEVVVAEYALAGPIECQFFRLGLNDTYLVKTKTTTYTLRIYRTGWRSLSEIQYELEALLYLQKAKISVSVPIRRKDGTLLGAIHAPEGVRYMVLFTYASGREPNYDSKDDNAAYVYGKIAAQIHTATETFQSLHRRVALIWNISSTARSSPSSRCSRIRTEDWGYLQTATEKLRRQVMHLPLSSLEQGFCHGDLHWGNARIQDERCLL